MSPLAPTLDEQRAEFARRRFLAMPMAGLVAWTVVAIGGIFLSPVGKSLLLFAATGSIVYLGMFFSKFTGEHFLDLQKPANAFDKLSFYCLGGPLLVFAIAIPFFLLDRTSLPLSVGVLTGLSWVPFSWIIQSNVGVLHAVARTVLVVAAWYLLPSLRFIAIPLIIVVLYVVMIVVLERRWRNISRPS